MQKDKENRPPLEEEEKEESLDKKAPIILEELTELKSFEISQELLHESQKQYCDQAKINKQTLLKEELFNDQDKLNKYFEEANKSAIESIKLEFYEKAVKTILEAVEFLEVTK